tara:strand:- start:140 stop:1225 length:1086 start_codon:yes stop_codon:yes gene_type:complete
MKSADKNKVPAGSALAVDRVEFSSFIDKKIKQDKNISFFNQEVTSLKQFKDDLIIIATGPLTSKNLANCIEEIIGKETLDFFDAIAPIVYADSIDMSICWKQSRYDKGSGEDYINCPLNKNQYYELIDLIKKSPKVEFKEFEKTPYFEGCLPIEEIIRRGDDTLRFGPMKPVGLSNPHSKEKPYAVVQLRQDNAIGTLFNMVGFQTKMNYNSQKNIFKMIPGMQNAKFARLGGLHRNTFLNSPFLLDENLRLKNNKNIYFAGQITGVEGYVESCAIGNLVGRMIEKHIKNQEFIPPPENSAHGALLKHITSNANPKTFQPMNINFGLMNLNTINKLSKLKGREKKKKISENALNCFKSWIN